MYQPTILLFDSGIGGLTVYDNVRRVLPHAHYLYCFDNELFPYSEKSTDELIAQAIKILTKITALYSLDLAVVACNTASTVVLPALRAHFSFPIVGTVPAIKPAASVSQTKTIGLLATKGTITRPYVSELIAKYAKDCIVEKIGSTDLVNIVEEKMRTQYVDMPRLRQVVAPWIDNAKLDTVILGCTHFPLVKEELRQVLPQVKFFVDSGYAIAQRVANLLDGRKNAAFSAAEKMIYRAFCTKASENFKIQQELIRQWGFDSLSVLN
ncbi:glutamate racemase [Mesocricetibacter intestinalis]|uniref:Glutamate racemase n=1 Tax=Mesocricetibacter intestinalis TaxID=1521930 RepID=A0A4R6V8A9_9PAST|nr:glutamate racemase [Mesocricetibacter intestinalis]TDQ57851.1 glutamate racemase [Mesocricetibacter intestinalis]